MHEHDIEEQYMNTPSLFSLHITETTAKCPIGETVGQHNIDTGKIPVLSCEGACIRGEIARLAANLVAKEQQYRRACHGELFSAPHSAMFQWVDNADSVIVIDGCFLHCHGRIVEHLAGKEKMIHFDALSHHKKYSKIFDSDDVPECERKAVARQVADWILACLNGSETSPASSPEGSPCQSQENPCCQNT